MNDAVKLVPEFVRYQENLPVKDINQYENPQFIKKLMVTIDSRKTQRQIEREIKTQADKIYEDNDVLVVRPKSHAASCYYGANTKWCTTQKGSTSYFDKYTRGGNLYYFLNKKTNNKIRLENVVLDKIPTRNLVLNIKPKNVRLSYALQYSRRRQPIHLVF